MNPYAHHYINIKYYKVLREEDDDDYMMKDRAWASNNLSIETESKLIVKDMDLIW